jgi:hypothetical protein
MYEGNEVLLNSFYDNDDCDCDEIIMMVDSTLLWVIK